jgi:putative endonuclease
MLTVSMKTFWVYILASRPRGTLYVGMTNDLVRRVYEHREGLVEGFSGQYRVKMLAYYEQHATALAAIQREKNIKHWSRAWKLDLIRKLNPDWRDLWEDIVR